MADTGAFSGKVQQALTFPSPGSPVGPFATGDGRHLMLAMDAWAGQPTSGSPEVGWILAGWPFAKVPVLFLSDDGGRTWRLAAFTAR